MTSDQKRPSVKHKRTVRSVHSRNTSPDSMKEHDVSFVNHDRETNTSESPASDDIAHTPGSLQMHEPSAKGEPLADFEASHNSQGSPEPFMEEPADFFDLGDEVPHSRYSRSAKKQGDSSVKQASTRQRSAQKSQKTEKEKAARKKVTRADVRRVVLIVLGVLIVAALVGGGYYVWNTFLRYDDAADVQGEWCTEDGAMTVVIDESYIRMPDLEYSYELDTKSKQITFSFSDLSGSGTYSFSEDRTQLTIVEGEGDSATTTVLIKMSDDTQADPQLLNDSSSSDTEDDEEGATSKDEAEDGTDTSEDASDASEEDEA